MEIATIVNYFRYKLIGMTESFDSFTYAYYELCMLIQHSTSLSLRDGHHRNKEADFSWSLLALRRQNRQYSTDKCML